MRFLFLLAVLALAGCNDKPTTPAPAAKVVFVGWGSQDSTTVHGTVQNVGAAAAHQVIVYTSTGYDSTVTPPDLAPGENGFFESPLYLGGPPDPATVRITWK